MAPTDRKRPTDNDESILNSRPLQNNYDIFGKTMPTPQND